MTLETNKDHFTDTLTRLLRVPGHELDEAERKWQEEQRDKREGKTG